MDITYEWDTYEVDETFAKIAAREFADLKNGIPESMSTYLANYQSFQIVERGRLNDALKEMQLSQTGLIDESTAAKSEVWPHGMTASLLPVPEIAEKSPASGIFLWSAHCGLKGCSLLWLRE